MDKHHALARDAILAALTAYTGITTADGAGDGSTLVDANLIGANDFISNKTILIGSGDSDREDSGASSFAPLTGTITFVSPFSAQIKRGTLFRVINISTVEIDVEAINTKIGTKTDAAGTTTVFARLRQIVDNYLDKLGGETPASDSVTANWNTATGTSGEAGEDLVTIGANDTKYKLHSLLLDVSALTDGASIHVKLFMQVNGVEKKVYDQTFTVPTGTTPPDTDGLWIVNGTVGIHEALRVEVYSDTNESVAIAYDYMLEAM